MFSWEADQLLVSDDNKAQPGATEEERAINEAVVDDNRRMQAKRSGRLFAWLDHLFISPLRWLTERPEGILAAYVQSGTNVLEVGCGAGFFTLPLARMVGSAGHVLCVDVQPRMLAALGRHARRAGLSQRIEARQCGTASLGLADHAGAFALALLVHVLHKLPNARAALAEIHVALEPDGHVLLIESPGRVSASEFEAQIEAAHAVGLAVESRAPEKRYRAALLRRTT